MNRKRLIFLFFDGVGVGKAANANPFYAVQADYLPLFGEHPAWPDGTPVKPIDATLGVPGIPMSATGQTALFTGVNAPLCLGGHHDSFPNQMTRRIIREKNLFSQLKARQIPVRFLNAYPAAADYFSHEHIRLREDGAFEFSPLFPSGMRGSISVTTCMMISAQIKPFSGMDIIRERALYHDFTNQLLLAAHPSFRLFTPEHAAEIIRKTSLQYRLTLFEYFLSDISGHSFEPAECRRVAQNLNRLVKHLVSLLNKTEDILLISSDHGNMENIASASHTLNPVPLILWGEKTADVRDRIQAITNITPAIIELLS